MAKGGKRKGAGRPKGATGKELKKRYTLSAYPSDVAELKKLGLKLQGLLNSAIRDKLHK